MKKYIYVIAGGILLFQVSEALKLSQYCDFQERKKEEFGRGFDESTDLVRGLIMLQSGALREHRHYGNTEFDPYSMKSAEVCSYKDKSSDAMTQLLILTFPSAGAAGFSAYGEGSIGEVFTDTDQMMQVIAGMFKLANEARDREKNGTAKNDCIDVIIKKAKNEDIEDDGYEKAVLSHFGFESLLSAYNEDLCFKIRPIKIIRGKVESIDEEDINNLLDEIRLLKAIYGTQRKSGQINIDKFKEEVSKSKNKKRWANVKYLPACVNKLTNSAELTNFINCLDRIEKLCKTLKGADKKNEILKRLDQTQNNIIKTEKNVDYEKIYKLFDLAKAIAGAILLERLDDNMKLSDEEMLTKYPYYIGYANNIICAYACSIINTDVEENLTKLACYLSSNEEVRQAYKSELTKKMKEYYDKYPSYIPFDAGSTPITNGSGIPYKDHKFADCVETTMRQLFAVLFCSKKGENGEWKEDLRLETSRIPDKGELHDFFQKYSQVNEIANGGNTDIRSAWANVCSGHQEHGIRYAPKRKECELDPEWRSMIRLFCLLMSEYDADKDTEQCSDNVKTQKREAAELIKEINKNGFDPTDGQDVVNALNTLLGIRGDVQFEVVNSNLSINGKGKMVGELTICPKKYTDGTKEIKPDNNKMRFCVSNTGGHAYVKKIGKVNDPLIRVETQKNDKFGLNYIRDLYSECAFTLESQFPVLGYYLKSRMLSNIPPNIADVMKYSSLGQYSQGIYRFSMATRGNFPNILSTIFKQANYAAKPNYRALGKTFLGYNYDNPRNFYYHWKNISKFMDLNECIDQSTKDQLYTKWSQLSTVDDLKGVGCFLADHSSINASILENMRKIKDWEMELEDWVTVGRIFNRINFTDDAQYSSLKPILIELRDAADKFVSTHNYVRNLILTKDFTDKEEILRIVLPFCSIEDQDIANNVKNWLEEKENEEKIDENMIIPIAGYLSDASFEKLVMNIINQSGEHFERNLCHIISVCHKNNKEREKKVSKLILEMFPTNKVIGTELASAIAGQVDDIPALIRKVDLKDSRTLKTVFIQLGDKKRENRFIHELVKTQDPKDLIESISSLSDIKVKNLGSRVGDTFVENKMNIPLSVAKLLVNVGNKEYDWLIAVKELYDSADNVSAILSTFSGIFLTNCIGNAYIRVKGFIPMPVAKVLIKAGDSGEDWLSKVEGLLDLKNISEIIELAKYKKERIADTIGKMYIDEGKPISMDVAKVLVRAKAYGTQWLSAVEELYDSDDNVMEILDASDSNGNSESRNAYTYPYGIQEENNKSMLADTIGQMYARRKKPISMKLAKILATAGASGDGWLDMVNELHKSTEKVNELLSVSSEDNRSELANKIGITYTKAKKPITMQLAKVLVAAKASGSMWIDEVIGLYKSTENVAAILNAFREDKTKSDPEVFTRHESSDRLADEIGQAYVKKEKDISVQLAKLLIEFGACGYGWIDKVSKLYDSDSNISAFINSFRDNEMKNDDVVAHSATADKNKSVDDDIVAGSNAINDNSDTLVLSNAEDGDKSMDDGVAKSFSKYKYNLPIVADKIGQTCVMMGKNISLQLAITLIEAGALSNNLLTLGYSPYYYPQEKVRRRGHGRNLAKRTVSEIFPSESIFTDSWLFEVKELYDSVDNVTKILDKLRQNKSLIANAIGMAYAERNIPISMQLAKIIIAEGDRICWMHAVEGIYNSIDNIIDLIINTSCQHSKVASAIGTAYARRNMPISMQLAKILIKFGSCGYDWIYAVEGIQDADNVIKLINEASFEHRLLVNEIGTAYAKRNMPVSMQLAKILVEEGASRYHWLELVENLFDPGNVEALLKVTGENRDDFIRKIDELRNRT